jgi:chemotaxis protein MotB
VQGDDETELSATSSASDQLIIIVKKNVTGGGHHGGAWKVAYADFVTAMMALFLVLWLMNASQQQKEAIAAYFTDPRGFEGQAGSGQSGSGTGLAVKSDDLEGLAEKIEQAMKELPQFEGLRQHVNMVVTGEGLRIELLETENGMFFESGSPTPSASGAATLTLIGLELAKLPNEVIIEGHTDSRPFRGREHYSNWELSSDRANAARRILGDHGLPSGRIAQVRGFADVQLRNPGSPEDPSNRRISLIVKFREEPVPTGEAPATTPAHRAPDHSSYSQDGESGTEGASENLPASASDSASDVFPEANP